MDHVVCSCNNADFFIHRDHQGIVNFKQIVVYRLTTLWAAIFRHFAMRSVQGRYKTNAFTFAFDVVVTPFPLHTRRFNSQVCVGCVFHSHHNLGCWQCHQNNDDERNDGPNHLNCY